VPQGADEVNITWNNYTPASVTATPSWNTNVWVTDITNSGAIIHFGTPPAKEEKVYWLAVE